MAELPLDDAAHFDLVVAEIDRELEMRAKVYPAWIRAGKLTQEAADRRNRLLRDARQALHGLRAFGAVVAAEVEAAGPHARIELQLPDGARRWYVPEEDPKA